MRRTYSPVKPGRQPSDGKHPDFRKKAVSSGGIVKETSHRTRAVLVVILVKLFLREQR